MFRNLKKSITILTILSMILSSFSFTNVFADNVARGGPSVWINFDPYYYEVDATDDNEIVISTDIYNYTSEENVDIHINNIHYYDAMGNWIYLDAGSYRFEYTPFSCDDYSYTSGNIFIKPDAINTTGMYDGYVMDIGVDFEYDIPSWGSYGSWTGNSFSLKLRMPASEEPVLDPSSATIPIENLCANGLGMPVTWGTGIYGKKSSNGIVSVRFYYNTAQDKLGGNEGIINFIIPSNYINVNGDCITIGKEFFTTMVLPCNPKLGHKVYLTVKFDTLSGDIDREFTLTLDKPVLLGEQPVINPPKSATLPLIDELCVNGLKIPVTWGTLDYAPTSSNKGVDKVRFYYNSAQDKTGGNEGIINFIMQSKYYRVEGDFIIISKEFFDTMVLPCKPKVGHNMFFYVTFGTLTEPVDDDFTLTIAPSGIKPEINIPKEDTRPMEDLTKSGLEIPVTWGTVDYIPTSSNKGVDKVRFYYNTSQDKLGGNEGIINLTIEPKYYCVEGNSIIINKEFFKTIILPCNPKVGHNMFFYVTFDTVNCGKVGEDEFKLTLLEDPKPPKFEPAEIDYTIGIDEDIVIDFTLGSGDYAKNDGDGIKGLDFHVSLDGPKKGLTKGLDYTVNVVGSSITIKKDFISKMSKETILKDDTVFYFDINFDTKNEIDLEPLKVLITSKPEILIDEINYSYGSGDVRVPVRWGTRQYAPVNNPKNKGVERMIFEIAMPWGPMEVELIPRIEYIISDNEIIIYEDTFDTFNLDWIKVLPFTITFDTIHNDTITDGFNLIYVE